MRTSTPVRLAGLVLLASGAAGLFAACNQHPVTYAQAAGVVEYIQTTNVEGSSKLDMLWVIDNSGSMCQEQSILRNNFELFVDKLQDTNLDFHLGVTTSDMNPNYQLEPVAQPGHLQSTPQPVPGFDRSCHTAVDELGQPIMNDFTPIREAIEAAVSCMQSPDESFNNVTNADIQCGLYNQPSGCTIAGKSCGGANAPCGPEDLFPSPATFRSIPKVLRSQDYKADNGTLDVGRLKADFGCMALVGTRGYGIEKGLSAAVQAVSPDMTGGPVDGDAAADNLDAAAPNHGLIRKNARFAVVFVTDENDCSHDGTLDEATPCGGDVCEFHNREGDANSPLIDPSAMKDELMKNLRETKRDVSFGDAQVLVASIHGNYKRFTGEVPTEAACAEPDYVTIPPSCATQLGRAFSGDRYERFLRSFPEGQFFPEPRPDQPDANLTGWMCTGDFRPALEAIGDFISQVGGGCITRPIYPCEGAGGSCPPYPFTGDPGMCTARPNSDPQEFYCDSAIQVRALATNSTAMDNLRNGGYCIEASLGDPAFPNGCVVNYDKYTFEPCSGGVSGVRLQWVNDNEARNALLNTEIQLRYNSQSSEGF